MKPFFENRVWIWVLLSLTMMLAVFLTLPLQRENGRFLEADRSYRAGEEASTLAAREKAFNQALESYTKLEDAYSLRYSNGKLYYNIANVYFQLGLYPEAILYYYRAQNLMPRNPKVGYNLAVAQEKLGLAAQPPLFALQKVLFFHYYLSLSERLQFFSFFTVLFILLASLYIWTPRRWTRRFLVIFGAISAIILVSALSDYYGSSIEGVIMQSSPIYRGAGEQYAKVIEYPIKAGSKVEVVEISRKGKWIKIITSDGNLGYVPQSAIRLI